VNEVESNVTPNKEYFSLLRDEHYQGCLTEVEGRTVSTEYREVEGFTPVSEYQIYKDNNGIFDILD
jgi:hypothetical protein